MTSNVQKSLRDKLPTLIKWGSVFLLGISLLLFENFNYLSTAESLKGLFGSTDWISGFALAVVLSDIAALGRVFTAEKELSKEPEIVKVLGIIWFVVSVFDTFLTFFYLAELLEENPNVASPEYFRPMLLAFVVIVAIMTWAIQASMLYLFGAILEQTALPSALRRSISPPIRPSQHIQTPKIPSPITRPPPKVTRPEPSFRKPDQQKGHDNKFAPRPQRPTEVSYRPLGDKFGED